MSTTPAPLHISLPTAVRSALIAGKRVQSAGVPEISAQVALIGEALATAPRSSLVWMVEDEDHQRRVVAALHALRIAADRHVSTELTPPVLASLLTSQPLALVITARAILTPLPEISHFRDGILHLRPGTTFSTTDLSRHLVEHGYIAESMVSGAWRVRTPRWGNGYLPGRGANASARGIR